MEKTKPAVLQSLEDNYKKACDAWVAELIRLWDLRSLHGYWVADEPGGVYDFDGAFAIGMSDIIYAVQHAVTYEQATEWQEYICWAGENDFDQPSIQDYVEARVPIMSFDAQQRITQARQDLIRLCAEERAKMLDNFIR